MAFLFFPIVGYAGLRFGPTGAATLVALLAAFALPVAALGLGPFAAFPLGFTQILLHLVPDARVAQRPDAGRGDGGTRGRDAAADRARRTAAPLAEDGSGRAAGRRHRARLQQPADGDHRLHRDRDDRLRARRSAARRRRGDQARRRCAPPSSRGRCSPSAASRCCSPRWSTSTSRCRRSSRCCGASSARTS